jgi:hypothetical protein
MTMILDDLLLASPEVLDLANLPLRGGQGEILILEESPLDGLPI